MVGDIRHCEVIRLLPADEIIGLAVDAVQPDSDLPEVGVVAALKWRVWKIAPAVVTMKFDMPGLECG